MNESKYAFAEIFTSVQGEGYWAGTPMIFFRVAGCPVGKLGNTPRAVCTSFTGTKFYCDTKYWKADPKLQARNRQELCDLILNQVRNAEKFGHNIQHICITGGEPFVYDWNEHLLYGIAEDTGIKMIHFETSGTLYVPFYKYDKERVWITCSPKYLFLPHMMLRRYVDELKLLVSATKADFNRLETFLKCFFRMSEEERPLVYLQPICNEHDEVDSDTLECVLELLYRFPGCRLSVQTHKFLGLQ